MVLEGTDDRHQDPALAAVGAELSVKAVAQVTVEAAVELLGLW